MKVLFAVDNDNISETIVKKYQRNYKEIISYKNVYYFNAILKELQNNKTYDRIVISEDLEPFANNDYDTIDKFLFDKLEKIKNEAVKMNGSEIEVVLICADRRHQSDEMLNKLFSIKLYNALVGDDRNVDTLCKLIRQPRTRQEAKVAYKIEGNNGMYATDDENGVSELEVQNILAHYKRLGKNEDKYVDSFNNIVSQYTDAQLKIIIRYLPLHVKAVLEEQSPKYQSLSTFGTINNNEVKPYTSRTSKTVKNDIDITMLKENKNRITKPIVIPEELDSKKNIKMGTEKEEHIDSRIEEDKEKNNENIEMKPEENVKRGRGRPRKTPVMDVVENKPKRGRGRPRKDEVAKENTKGDLFETNGIDEFDIKNNDTVKQEEIIDGTDFDLFNFGQEHDETENLQEIKTTENEENQEDFDLFNLEEIDNKDNLDLFNLEDGNSNNKEEQEDLDLFNLEETNNKENIDLFDLEDKEDSEFDLFNINEQDYEIKENELLDRNDIQENYIERDEIRGPRGETNTENNTYYIEETTPNNKPLNMLLTNEKKIVSFVGTTKNGTSFVVNNLGLTLAEMNISTAILDMTKNKNSYYTFTNNEEKLKRIAEDSISNLARGVAEGLRIAKNLTVYTQLPGTDGENQDIETVLATLVENHDVVLIDTDFDTDISVFEESQEIYLVQSMDILTIQPFTAFLRNLKMKNVLKQEKIRVIINKAQKLRKLSDDLLLRGMSAYNDPSMTLLTELFDKEYVRYIKIPFETQNYAKYLDSLVECKIILHGYTKSLIQAFNELAQVVYPLINKGKNNANNNKKNKLIFSENTNSTLNKMRKNY